MHSPTPRVQHIVDQGQCILLFQAVRVADDFCVGPELVDFVGEFLVWVGGQVGAGVDAGGAVSYDDCINLDRLCCMSKESLPANSCTMALPMACVAPVTIQTKPYCDLSAISSHYRNNNCLAYQLSIRSVRREMLTLIFLENSSRAHLVSGLGSILPSTVVLGTILRRNELRHLERCPYLVVFVEPHMHAIGFVYSSFNVMGTAFRGDSGWLLISVRNSDHYMVFTSMLTLIDAQDLIGALAERQRIQRSSQWLNS